MIDSYPLITTIVLSVVFAFLLGFAAHKLKLPPILGYLLAGVLLGPYTPGFVANLDLANQLAEIGIILLMFGVGLHFSVKDLIECNKTAVPGAVFQFSSTVLIGTLLATLISYNFLESVVFGIALSVASTVVLLRAFEQYKILNSPVGKIGIGWLIVEDLVMIIILVLLPIIAKMVKAGEDLDIQIIFKSIFLILLKISAFVIVMMVIGRKYLPKLLTAISKTRSQELMSLGTLAIASGFAFIAYTLFDASFALGAFIAGLILNESEVGKMSAKKSLPLRHVFAVLFFISTGMLFDPKIIANEPILVLASILIVSFIKPISAYIIMRFFKKSLYESLIMSAGLAQIGEFSFILTA